MQERVDTIERRPPGRRNAALGLANLLTFARLAAVPALAAVMFFVEGEAANWAALAIFTAAAVTDFLDGWVARAWGQQSALGRMLDPIADKLIVGAALLLLVANQTIAGLSVWAALIILSREILVSGLREFLAELNVRVAVTRLAKWKTAVQMAALCFLLAGGAGDNACGCATDIGLALLWAAALVTLYTGFDYFRAGLKYALEYEERR
ncbi:MAG: CDP-diacylglycerol--glycerol-3-phosphate 3-phosphatidyltransferase [Hyphomicrobiales bacterium]|nr:CDP-diacylglycerol--glycerol-3-phosphate 3-phosphatidyltransferase [Hyphomicrobiales bacterium]